MITGLITDLGVNRNFNTTPNVEEYSNQLEYYIKTMLAREMPEPSKKAENILFDVIRRNDNSILTDIDEISDDLGRKTTAKIKGYTRCIMIALGKIAECVVIDRCANDANCNMKFINIATMAENINIRYSDLAYHQFTPFSPSQKHFIAVENGILRFHNVPDPNANHETKDIGWCNRDNPLDQLRFVIPSTKILQEAKVQIKATINPEKLRLDKYITTPVIVFNLSDLHTDCLHENYPNHYIIDAREIDMQLFHEIEMYFKLITSYVIGYSNTLKINQEMFKDERIGYLFRSSTKQLLNYEPFNSSGVLELVREFQQPIAIYS